MHKIIFTLGASDKREDLLEAAVSITQFLADVSPSIAEKGSSIGITDGGAIGLQMILEGLCNTMEAAKNAIN